MSVEYRARNLSPGEYRQGIKPGVYWARCRTPDGDRQWRPVALSWTPPEQGRLGWWTAMELGDEVGRDPDDYEWGDEIKRTSNMRKCPGCGDRADIDHIVACCASLGWTSPGREASLATLRMRDGARELLAMVRRQLQRRGHIKTDLLCHAIDHIEWRKP